jgi:TolB-like protein/Tfp pilus assembly protein PilF
MVDFRFGRFDVDLRARELRKDGVRLRLQDQPFEVLAMLLEHPGEVITRDELRARLWPHGTFVDFEHGLNAAVKRLRAALGDNADRPRFVETLHRRGYRFIGRVERGNGEGAGGYDEDDSPDTRKRLAVLPFTNVNDEAPEFFAGGLTEELMTQLGRFCANTLGIIARSSSMRVQRGDRTIRAIGEALRAHYLIEGSVRTSGDRARVTVQLVETRRETQLWADSFERPLTDCLLVQSEVAAQIVHRVATELLPDRASRGGNGTNQVEAFQNYLKGRYHWNRPGSDGLLEALAYFERACELDPHFAAAHAATARCRVAIADYYVSDPRATLLAAREAAQKALELDPSDSQAYLALAEVRRVIDWDWKRADDEYRRSLAFNPNNEATHRLYGLFLMAQGRSRDAREMVERACDLDPLCLVSNTGAAWVRYLSRDYESAIEQCRHTLDMEASFAGTHRVLSAALVQVGRVAEAIAQLESFAGSHRDPSMLAGLAHALAVNGERARAAEVVACAERLAADQYVSPYHLAIACAGLEDVDRAFAQLDRACEDRDPAIMNVAIDPRFDLLRSDTRYAALAGRLNLDN